MLCVNVSVLCESSDGNVCNVKDKILSLSAKDSDI